MTIEIKMNETLYRIYPELGCYTLMKVGTSGEDSKKAGEEKETNMGYPMSLSKAVNKIIRDQIANNPDTVSLQEYAAYVDNIKEEIKELLQGYEL